MAYMAQVATMHDPDAWVDVGMYNDRPLAEVAARSAHARYDTAWRVIEYDPDPTPPHGIVRRNPFHIGEGACSNPDHEGLACQ